MADSGQQGLPFLPTGVGQTQGAGSAGTEEPLGSQGSFVRAEYVERTMTFWLITKAELETVSLMNGLSNAFFGAGAFFFSAAIGFVGDYKFSESASHSDWLLALYGGTAGLVIGLVFFAVAIWALIKKHSVIKDLKQESKVVRLTCSPMVPHG